MEDCHERVKELTANENFEQDDQEKVQLLQQLFSFSQYASCHFAYFTHFLCRPPLTLQRLCELVLDGPKWYQTPHKLIRALDRNLHISPSFNEEEFEKEAFKERTFIPLRLVSTPPLPGLEEASAILPSSGDPDGAQIQLPEGMSSYDTVFPRAVLAMPPSVPSDTSKQAEPSPSNDHQDPPVSTPPTVSAEKQSQPEDSHSSPKAPS